jgi:transcriptional antiterminator
MAEPELWAKGWDGMDVRYQVAKVLNNNVVFARSHDGKEYVLVGKGIGFGKRRGDSVPVEQIEKRYILSGSSQYSFYHQVLDTIDPEIIGVCEEIIRIASDRLQEPLNPHIHVALTDHVAFAMERFQTGVPIQNPLLKGIQAIYPEEYQLGQAALALIEQRLHVRLPDEEAGYIALHIQGARKNQAVSDVLKHTQFIEQLVMMIEQELSINISRTSLEYARLVTHLRFAMERMEKQMIQDPGLAVVLKKDFPQCYNIAKKVAESLQAFLGMPVPEAEIGYLTIHIKRLQLLYQSDSQT